MYTDRKSCEMFVLQYRLDFKLLHGCW